MQVTPDATHRIVLTREIREALNLKPGEPLNVSISAGAVFLSPVPVPKGKIIQKGKLKVYSGKIPNIDIEQALGKARRHSRM
jgi:hypothetical protein